MKRKLNNGGFTLIELLAVIIILAIVVGITVPSVLNSVSDSKTKAFRTSLETMADWLERQYQVAQVSDATVGEVNSALITLCGNKMSGCVNDGTSTQSLYDATTGLVTTNGATILKSAGVKSGNYSSLTFYISESTGRACVKAVSKSDGDFGEQERVSDASTTPPTTTTEFISSGC